MEEEHCLVGKTCNIHIDFSGQNLFYKGRILYMGAFQVTFMDKFKKIYSYNLKNVVEIEEVEGDLYEKSGYEKT